jgi:hypothetical protein
MWTNASLPARLSQRIQGRILSFTVSTPCSENICLQIIRNEKTAQEMDSLNIDIAKYYRKAGIRARRGLSGLVRQYAFSAGCHFKGRDEAFAAGRFRNSPEVMLNMLSEEMIWDSEVILMLKAMILPYERHQEMEKLLERCLMLARRTGNIVIAFDAGGDIDSVLSEHQQFRANPKPADAAFRI